MAFSFPANPAANDTYTVGSRTWTWTGSFWEMTSGLITTQQLADQGVTEAKIADSAVTTAKIAAGAVVEADIGTGAVTATKIGTGAVTETKIGANAVTQAKLASTLSAITICTSSTRPGSPFTGQTVFETDTLKLKVYNGSSWTGVSTMKKVAAFSSSGSWTVPTGVTYAIAYIRAAGGGIGSSSNAGSGGNSSVAFAGGTVTATGGAAANMGFGGGGGPQEKIKISGATNSGLGAKMAGSPTNYTDGERFFASAGDGAFIVSGGSVTAGASISVTVGAGGAAGTYSTLTGASGGSGYVWIEYEE